MRPKRSTVDAQRDGSCEDAPDATADANARKLRPRTTKLAPTSSLIAQSSGRDIIGEVPKGTPRAHRETGADDRDSTAGVPSRGIKRPSAPSPIFIQYSARSFTAEQIDSAVEDAATPDNGTNQQDHASIFHPYCTQEKSDRIDLWLSNTAHHTQLDDAATAMAVTTTIYKDWLDWGAANAMIWLQKLDKFERRFRIASLKYHQTPYQIRHSSSLLHGARIKQVVLNRLSTVLETDRSRNQQSFFVPWFEISNAAVDILEDMKYYEPLPDDIEFRRTVLRKFELSLYKLPKSCRALQDVLQWLEDAVEAVSERSDLDGSEALAAKYSREGGLFRRWIQTLPEVGSLPMESKSRYMEWYVDRVLDVGVEKDQYWSLANLSGSKGKPSGS
jgi:hypothetical protein